MKLKRFDLVEVENGKFIEWNDNVQEFYEAWLKRDIGDLLTKEQLEALTYHQKTAELFRLAEIGKYTELALQQGAEEQAYIYIPEQIEKSYEDEMRLDPIAAYVVEDLITWGNNFNSKQNSRGNT